MNLVDRSIIKSISEARERGVKTFIIVNAEMVNEMVAHATCRVLDENGILLLSLTVTNPAPHNSIYLGNRGTRDIITNWADEITGN